MFRDGKPCPKNKWTNKQWRRPLREEGQFEWLGWMIGRAKPMLERIRNMQILGIEDNDIDPDDTPSPSAA